MSELKARLGSSVLALLLGASGAFATDNTFNSRRDRFVVRYPNSWHSFTTDSPFWIGNFPASKSVPVYVIPDQGAAILIYTARGLMPPKVAYVAPTDLGAWVVSRSARPNVVQTPALSVSVGTHTIEARALTTKCCIDPPFQEAVEWYFQLDGEFFVAIVGYWKGDPGASRYLEVLKQVVSTIRVTK